MSWKPEEREIIDYIYGSMTPDEKKNFEDNLKENPELEQEIKELRKTQSLLPFLPDEEVIPPLVFSNADSKSASRKTTRWLIPISIAASIALILVTGYLTQFRMSFNQKGFELGFANEQPEPALAFNQADIERLIESRMAGVKTELTSQLLSLEKGFDSQLANNSANTSKQIEDALKRSSKAQNDKQMLAFMSQLKDENEKMIANFYKVSAEEQQKYIRNILLEYNSFLEEQRKDDLQYLQANFVELKTSSEQKQQETEKLLASIISAVNSQYSLGQ